MRAFLTLNLFFILANALAGAVTLLLGNFVALLPQEIEESVWTWEVVMLAAAAAAFLLLMVLARAPRYTNRRTKP